MQFLVVVPHQVHAGSFPLYHATVSSDVVSTSLFDRTPDLPVCSAVPQPTAPQCDPPIHPILFLITKGRIPISKLTVETLLNHISHSLKAVTVTSALN